MVVIVLVFLFSALSRVEPATVFALEAKPLELNILGDEHCEYGLSRRRPYKWCICWGKIGIRVEVLPWDCTTRAPIGLRRKRTRHSNSKLTNFLSGLYSEGNSSPRKPLTFGNWGIPLPQEKLDSLLEEAGTFMLKEIVESESGNSLLAEELRQLLVPYLRSYIDPTYRKPSLVSRVLSNLKFLLSELDNPKNKMELEHYLWELKSEWIHLKNFIITELKELLVSLKGTSDKSQEIANKGAFYELVENDELAPKDDANADMTQSGSTSTKPEEKISFVSVSDDDPYLSKMLDTNKALSKSVDDRLVTAIVNNALATEIAQILHPAIGRNAVLGSSPNLSEGTKNYIKTEYSNTQAGVDDNIPSDQASLARNGLDVSKIGKILLPRRPSPDVISRDVAVRAAASRINNFDSGQVAKISILKTDNSPQDLYNTPDSVLRSSVNPSKSSGVEHRNSLTVKISRSSYQAHLHTEQPGNYIHRNVLIIPELTEHGDSSVGNVNTSSESSKFGTSSGSELNLTSRTDTNPEKREYETQKRMNSSELTRQDDSAIGNSGTRSETSKFGILSDSKHEELEDINETLMNSPKLTSSAVSTHENVGSASRILKLENASIPTISSYRYHTPMKF